MRILCAVLLYTAFCNFQNNVSAGNIVSNDDGVHYFTTSQNLKGRVYLQNWFQFDQFADERGTFLELEESFERSCPNRELFYINGHYYTPSACETLTICNQTSCLRFSRKANKLFYIIRVADINGTITSRFSSDSETFDKHTKWYAKELMMSFKNSEVKQTFTAIKPRIKFAPNFANSVYIYLSENCDTEIFNELYLFGKGALPHACSNIRVCNTMDCFAVPLTSMAQAFFHPRAGDPDSDDFSLPGNCSLTVPNRYKRGVISRQQTIHGPNEEEMGRITNTTFGILRFNLPGYRYCGPGTNVEEMDNMGGPLNSLDDLCRQHDVDYMLGVSPDEADAKLLSGMYDIRHPFYSLFATVFESKRYFEMLFGSDYTSALYYLPTKEQSLLYTLYRRVAYDNKHLPFVDPEALEKGSKMEKAWLKRLREIWSGYCSLAELPAPTSRGNGNEQQPTSSNAQPQQASSAQQSSSTLYITPSTSMSMQISDESELQVNVDFEYPVLPLGQGGCRVVISEFVTREEDDLPNPVPSFLELERRCPPRTYPKGTTLGGFHVLVLRVGDPPTIYLSENLHTNLWRSVSERVSGHKTPRTHHYFVIGSKDVSPDLLFDRIKLMVTPENTIRGLPAEDDETFAIVLLHFPTVAEHDEALKFLQMNGDDTSGYEETELMEEAGTIFQKYLQDMLIYGSPCTLEQCEALLKLMPNPLSIEPVDSRYIPIPYVTQREVPPFISLNRCADNQLPMQINNIEEADATPGTKNNCPIEDKVSTISFFGSRLQSSAQKIVVNAYSFFQDYFARPRVLTDNPVKLTSQACSLHPITVQRVLQNWRTGSMVTPGKRRTVKKSVQCQIDNYYAGAIRDVIKNFYAQNKAPMARDIYLGFLKFVKDAEDTLRNAGQPVEKPFKCGERTFRKILKRLGYRYGKINMRDMLLMRPDIVLWRGKYLQAMRKNRQSENPMKVIYLDETWIDPHARTGKAWILARPKNYRERAEFGYRQNKVSRGPRVIILNAGGEDGMFHDAMEVFSVSKNDASGDYHDNVNSDFYIAWFRRLVDSLLALVQDNAPYHGASEVPKSNDRKAKMYDWLTDNLPLAERLKNMKPENQMRKFELWELIKKQKETRNFYVVDKIAEDSGHKVLRIPPYNCDLNPIEGVWKDVKHSVRSRNTQQTLQSVIDIAKDVMLNYPVETWKAHVEHTKKLEEEYWTADGIQEVWMEGFSLVVPINDDDNDDDEDENNVVPIDPTISISTVHDPIIEEEEEELLDV